MILKVTCESNNIKSFELNILCAYLTRPHFVIEILILRGLHEADGRTRVSNRCTGRTWVVPLTAAISTD